MPWSVRGIDPEIREQAMEAAHRSGLSLGQWLNEVLAGNLEEEGEERGPARGRRRKGTTSDGSSRNDELNERLERLGRNRTATAAHRLLEPEAENGRVLELIETAFAAIERLERRQTSQPSAPLPASPATTAVPPASMIRIADDVEHPSPQPRRLSNGRSAAMLRPDRLETPEFQRAVSEIDERRRTLDEARTGRAAEQAMAEPIDGMRRQLDTLLARIEDMRVQAGRETVPLRERIDQIAERLESWPDRANEDALLIRRDIANLATAVEMLAPHRLVDMVENAVANVAEKSFGQSRNPLPERVLAPVIAVQQEIRDVLGELAASQVSERLSQEVSLVARRLEEISRKDAAPAQMNQVLRETQAIRNLVEQAMNAQPLEALANGIEALGRKLEIAHAEPDRHAERAVMDAVYEIRDRIEQFDARSGFRALEKRLAAITEIEHRLGALTGIERRLDELARDVGRIAVEKPALPQLDRIAVRLERIDRVLEGVRDQPAAAFGQLAEKIDRLETSIDRMGAQAANDEMMMMLDHLAARVAETARRDDLPTFDPHGFDSLHREIAQINERLETSLGRAGAQAANDEMMAMLDHLAARVAETATRHDLPVFDSQAFDTLHHEIAQLGNRLERSLDRVGAQAANEEMMAMLNRLSTRITELGSRGEPPAYHDGAFDALHREIAQLGERLQRSEAAKISLDDVQRVMEDIIGKFDAVRADLHSSAAQAAERATREAIRSIARDDRGDTLAAEGLLLLKRDLNEFKAAQNEAERRTRQTLESLQVALETLANRLTGQNAPGARHVAMPESPRLQDPPSASVASSRAAPPPIEPVRETGSAAGARPAATADAGATAAMRNPLTRRAMHEMAPGSSSIGGANPAPEMTASSRMAAPDASAARSSTPPEMFDNSGDIPLEVGERPDTSRVPGGVPTNMGQDLRASFIAAARRAVQASHVPGETPGAGEMPKTKSGKAARKPNGADGEAGTIAARLAGARKPLLLGFAALVLGIGAVNVTMMMWPGGGNDTAQPPSATLERPANTVPAGNGPAKPETAPERTGSIPVPAEPASSDASKRATRLAESSAIVQADPLTVGSIAHDGAARPIETGREALAELGRETRIPGQDRLRETAIGGSLPAMFEIGSRFADGRGVTRDPKLAARWLEQAAAQGHAPAQYRLASLFREGRGVAKDSALAFQWFDRAAAQGHVLAMHNAGVLLAEGVHGAPDYAGAALWFRRAAEYGVKDSQFNVAILFARGLGVNQDLGEAFRWFSLAAAQGDPDAGKKRDDLAARLTREQLAAERERLKAFKPTAPNIAANDPGNWERTAALPFPPIGRPAP